MSKFKVGDRVRLLTLDGGSLSGFEEGDECTFVSANEPGGRVRVRSKSGVIGYTDPDKIAHVASVPTPTPAEKLRAAAEVPGNQTRLGLAEEGRQVVAAIWILQREADHLEAAAAPKPTLREAVEAYRAAMEKGPQVGAEYAAMIEALAREEASKS